MVKKSACFWWGGVLFRCWRGNEVCVLSLQLRQIWDRVIKWAFQNFDIPSVCHKGKLALDFMPLKKALASPTVVVLVSLVTNTCIIVLAIVFCCWCDFDLYFQDRSTSPHRAGVPKLVIKRLFWYTFLFCKVFYSISFDLYIFVACRVLCGYRKHLSFNSRKPVVVDCKSLSVYKVLAITRWTL